MTTSEKIQIVDILLTGIIGIWLAVIVERNLTKSRFLREYFVEEIKGIRDEYKVFFNDVYKGRNSAVSIKDWLKVMSLRIKNIDSFIHNTYKINNRLIKDKHSEIQRYITGLDEFNNNFSSPSVKFSSTSIHKLLKYNADITKILMQRVIDINKAKEPILPIRFLRKMNYLICVFLKKTRNYCNNYFTIE